GTAGFLTAHFMFRCQRASPSWTRGYLTLAAAFGYRRDSHTKTATARYRDRLAAVAPPGGSDDRHSLLCAADRARRGVRNAACARLVPSAGRRPCIRGRHD